MPIAKNKLSESLDEHGIFFRNPSHVEEASFSETQGDIVDALVGVDQPISEVTLQYTDNDKPWSLSGFTKIRTMSVEDIEGLFNSLMRYRPNIFSIHIVLGDYEKKQKPLNSNKLRALQPTKQQFASEIAQKLADLFNDKSYLVTELIFKINNVNGKIVGSCKAAYVEEEDYKNNDLFNPAVRLEFYTNR